MTKRPVVYVASPSRDRERSGWAEASQRRLLVQLHAMGADAPFAVADDARQWDEDVVVVRSRYLRQFRETPADLLLFHDADVAFSPELVIGMVRAQRATGAGLILAPYRKKVIAWGQVAELVAERWNTPGGVLPTARELEIAADVYSFHLLRQDHAPDEHGLVPCLGGGLGLSLISREAADRVTFHVRDREPDRIFDDHITIAGGAPKDVATAATFFHRIERQGNGLRSFCSEDMAFCLRYADERRAAGKTAAREVRPLLYLGEGAPAHHSGPMLFEGHAEAFAWTSRK